MNDIFNEMIISYPLDKRRAKRCSTLHQKTDPIKRQVNNFNLIIAFLQLKKVENLIALFHIINGMPSLFEEVCFILKNPKNP